MKARATINLDSDLADGLIAPTGKDLRSRPTADVRRVLPATPKAPTGLT